VVETRRAGRSMLFLFLSVCCRPVLDSSKKKTAKKAKHKNIEKILATHAPFTIIGFFYKVLCTHIQVTHFYIFYVFSMDHQKEKKEECGGGGRGGGRQKRHAAFLLPGYIQFITVYYTFYKKWMALWYNKGNTHTHTHR
jgi:hypothetical protein